MIFMKGPGCDEEIAAANSSHADTFRLAEDHAYEIPGTPHRRRLVVYERVADAEDRPAERSHRLTRSLSAGFEGEVREITSASNPTYRRLQAVLGGPGIREHGEAILAGIADSRRGPGPVPRAGPRLADGP